MNAGAERVTYTEVQKRHDRTAFILYSDVIKTMNPLSIYRRVFFFFFIFFMNIGDSFAGKNIAQLRIAFCACVPVPRNHYSFLF